MSIIGPPLRRAAMESKEATSIKRPGDTTEEEDVRKGKKKRGKVWNSDKVRFGTCLHLLFLVDTLFLGILPGMDGCRCEVSLLSMIRVSINSSLSVYWGKIILPSCLHPLLFFNFTLFWGHLQEWGKYGH